MGTRTVYLTEDINDIHGQLRGPLSLGYIDIDSLYLDPLWPEPYQLYQSQYYTTTGISNLNPVYFDLVGPWYFWMTTPWKCIEEVIGIHEAPDAAEFPQATYAVRYLIIGSGGVRVWGLSYRSNDPTAKKWFEWGGTVELFLRGEETATKEMVHFYRTSGTKESVPFPMMSFPLSVGTTGTIDEFYVDVGNYREKSGLTTYNVVAQGKITVPSGTYDALMVKYDWTPNCRNETRIEYTWIVQGIGMVTHITSLPNEIGPTFKEATHINVLESQKAPPAPAPSQAPPTSSAQPQQ